MKSQADEEYTSSNTHQLDVDGTVEKIKGTDYIQEELRKVGK